MVGKTRFAHTFVSQIEKPLEAIIQSDFLILKRRSYPLCFDRSADRAWRPPICPIITIPDVKGKNDGPIEYTSTKVTEPGKPGNFLIHFFSFHLGTYES